MLLDLRIVATFCPRPCIIYVDSTPQCTKMYFYIAALLISDASILHGPTCLSRASCIRPFMLLLQILFTATGFPRTAWSRKFQPLQLIAKCLDRTAGVRLVVLDDPGKFYLSYISHFGLGIIRITLLEMTSVQHCPSLCNSTMRYHANFQFRHSVPVPRIKTERKFVR